MFYCSWERVFTSHVLKLEGVCVFPFPLTPVAAEGLRNIGTEQWGGRAPTSTNPHQAASQHSATKADSTSTMSHPLRQPPGHPYRLSHCWLGSISPKLKSLFGTFCLSPAGRFLASVSFLVGSFGWRIMAFITSVKCCNCGCKSSTNHFWL